MLRNYFKIAFRNLKRQKGYALINILGLAVGLASCMIILLFVFHELSYDMYNKNADRIYRVAGIVSLLAALLTVSWQSVRAAVANPVDSLRNE